MRVLNRVIVIVSTAVLLSAVLTACAGSAEKTVPYTATSVDLAPGEALVVEFGEVNGSVGDEWVLTEEPDPAILGEGEELTRALGDAPGSPSELSYRFEPVGAGTTVITWEYRFRGEVPEEPADQRTAEIRVTVG